MKYASLARDCFVSDAIINVLDEAGVQFVLGMPGGNTGPLWQALHKHSRIRAIQVREESIGSIMAEAYGRLTGTPAVLMGQGEWIVGNAGQGYVESLLGSSPVVILTEMSDGGPFSHHAPYQSGSGDYGTWSAEQALRGTTKRLMVSYTPVQAVHHTQLAIKHAVTGQPGPVAVIYHSAALRGRVGPTTMPRIYESSAYLLSPSRAVDEVTLAQAADSLHHAERPVLVAGNGVRVGRARTQLVELARALDAPVATTASGKGVIAETDPLAVGPIGTFGWPSANKIVGEADVVLAVGTKLAASDTLNGHPTLIDPSRQTLIQIDIEPLNVSWTFPVDYPLVGDAAHLMDLLAQQVSPRQARPSGRDRVALALESNGHSHDRHEQSEPPFDPYEVIACLDRVLPDGTIVAADAGENRLFMMQWFHSRRHGDYLQPAAGGGMGYAVPAAMAVKLAEPDRPVVAVCGDGGFAMSIHALMTAHQAHLPVAVIVFNNRALGWVLHGMGDQPVGAHLPSVNHAAIAKSLGCAGTVVSSMADLECALKGLAALAAPLLLDVPTSLARSFHDVEYRPETT